VDSNEYRDIYLAESREYLQSLNESLLKLETEPGNTELVQQMFRSAHSLKGMSATMGYDDVTRLTHEMENLLQLLRDGSIHLSGELADTLFSSLDALEVQLTCIENNGKSAESVSPILERLATAYGNPAPGGARGERAGKNGESMPVSEHFNLEEFEKVIIREAFELGENVYTIEVAISEDSLLKSVRAYMVIKALEEHGTLLKVKPSVSDLEEDKFEHTFHVLYQSVASAEEVEGKINNILEIDRIRVEKMALSRFFAAGAGGEPVPERRHTDPQAGQTLYAKTVLPSHDKTVRVDTGKLDNLINLVGELVINRTRLVELGRESTHSGVTEAAEQLNRITSDLQSAVMKLRMVPIKQVFDRFPRMVRDLGRDKGKNVRLEIIGEATELDRSIVNQIGEPLVHLLRNAVDHGIETEEERKKAGKNSEGCIRLEARHEGSYVAIEVRDDGRGLSEELIIEKALKKKIVTGEEAERLRGAGAYKLIFENGFSTAEEVTDISGRGVGMDAVKKIVEKLNGLTDVQSTPGKGTRITIRLPLTLAIIKALLVTAGGETYAIPVENVRENLYIKAEEIHNVYRQKVISLRNEVIPLIPLQKSLFGSDNLHWDSEVPAVIVTSGDKKAGLLVDQLLGQQEVVIKSLSALLGRLKGIAGATILGNGKVALILNIATLT
jgi:two-component system chemotaxis sensor kinase CheA